MTIASKEFKTNYIQFVSGAFEVIGMCPLIPLTPRKSYKLLSCSYINIIIEATSLVAMATLRRYHINYICIYT